MNKSVLYRDLESGVELSNVPFLVVTVDGWQYDLRIFVSLVPLVLQ